jgi:hypothetical protein
MPRVLLVVPPFHQVFIPAIGVSLLKAALARLGIPCDVWYLNIRFAERLGPDLYTSIASEDPRWRGLHGGYQAEWTVALRQLQVLAAPEFATEMALANVRNAAPNDDPSLLSLPVIGET